MSLTIGVLISETFSPVCFEPDAFLFEDLRLCDSFDSDSRRLFEFLIGRGVAQSSCSSYLACGSEGGSTTELLFELGGVG